MIKNACRIKDHPIMVHIYFQIKRHSGGEHGNNNFGIIFGVFLIAAGLADIHDEKWPH